MSTKLTRRGIPLALTVLMILSVLPCYAQAIRATPADLVPDLQKMARTPGVVAFVWWLPPEFWIVSAAADPTLDEDQGRELARIFQKHMFFGIVDAEQSPLGFPEYRTPEATRKRLRLTDANGATYRPLEQSEIDPQASAFLKMFQPALGAIIGDMGENMRFFAFPVEDVEGRPIAGATQAGSFTITIGDEEFRWALPLDSLAPPKLCPTDGEELKGTWNYCPIHGDRLSPSVASTARE